VPYTFKRLDAGSKWTIIKAQLPRRSAGEAFARDYFAARGLTILLLDHDDENDAIDIMTTRGDELVQYVVEPVPVVEPA